MVNEFGQQVTENETALALFSDKRWSELQARLDLTPRHAQVCRLVCRGFANKNIARELGVTLDTVRMHLREIFRRLGVGSRVMLVVTLVLADRDMSAAEHTATAARASYPWSESTEPSFDDGARARTVSST